MNWLLRIAAACVLMAAPAFGQRLSGDAIPDRYSLWFAPDLAAQTFSGRTTIDLRLTQPSPTITLHASELTFDTATVRAGGQTQTARIVPDPATETATLTVERSLPAGQVRVEIAYRGVLNDKLRGFYISKANGRSYAVTQMEATDARRAFPSFDEPAYKATFDISVMADRADTVLSNGRQVSDTPGPEAGKHTVTFARTAKMSTYLVAMIVGDFVCRAGSADGTPIRVCSTPDKLALTGFALDAAQQQLAFFNRYFGIRYPFGKLDIIAVPDFSAGAMENTGAITFRERLLLVDPGRTSIAVQKRVASIVSHEIAHQWFGNLVTMKWWDDIWLNEGFATWMANKPLAAWRPAWRIGVREAEATQGALGIDALQSTRPIRLRVNTPEEINQVFDGIAYDKTAAVLRMVEAYVGPTAFRDAVRSYLKRFSYGNATGEDFWNEVTRVTGRPVDRIMRSFVDQPGAPVVSVRATCGGGTGVDVTLSQERFAAPPMTAPASAATTSWTLPVCTKTSTGARSCELIEGREVVVRAPRCEGVFANADGVGYFFTEHPIDTVGSLTRDPASLTPAERLRLLGDEWWMVRAGRHEIDAYLDLAAALAMDDTPEVLSAITLRLSDIRDNLVDPAHQAKFDGWLQRRFGPQLEALGWPGAASDDEDRQSRRVALLALVGLAAGDAATERRARELAVRYMADPSTLPPTIAATVLRVAAAGGDRSLYDLYRARLEKLAAQPEEYFRFFNALPGFRDPDLVARTLEMALEPSIRSQDAGALIGGVFESPWGREAAWTFVTERWSALTAKLDIFQSIPGVVANLGVFCSRARAAEVRTFFEANPVPAASRLLRQGLERIESCVDLRARQAAPLAAWLARQP